jgi:hypothetical protein
VTLSAIAVAPIFGSQKAEGCAAFGPHTPSVASLDIDFVRAAIARHGVQRRANSFFVAVVVHVSSDINHTGNDRSDYAIN